MSSIDKTSTAPAGLGSADAKDAGSSAAKDAPAGASDRFSDLLSSRKNSDDGREVERDSTAQTVPGKPAAGSRDTGDRAAPLAGRGDAGAPGPGPAEIFGRRPAASAESGRPASGPHQDSPQSASRAGSHPPVADGPHAGGAQGAPRAEQHAPLAKDLHSGGPTETPPPAKQVSQAEGPNRGHTHSASQPAEPALQSDLPKGARLPGERAPQAENPFPELRRDAPLSAGMQGPRKDAAGDAQRLADGGVLAGAGQTAAQRLDAGLPPLGQTTAAAGPATADVDIISELADRILVAEPKGGENEVRIKLNIDTLQGTEITLRRDANGLQIAFETPSPEIAERLAAARDGLTERLSEKTGLEVNVEIAHAEQDDMDRGGERNDGRSRNRFDYARESDDDA